jgi:hypothetical protein
VILKSLPRISRISRILFCLVREIREIRGKFLSFFLAALVCVCQLAGAGEPVRGGPLPPPLPLFPADNWWNLDMTSAPVDSNSASFINFINNGTPRRLHPDFGGNAAPGSVEIYGFPYIVVDSTQPKKAVSFFYASESDGAGVPFYPIPDEAITQPYWIEGGQAGNIDLRNSADRHMLIVDRDNRHLYELYNVFYDGSMGWKAGSGAFFDMNTNNRRPEGWTSADAAGLAILPGLVRYDEVFGPDEIRHAFRVTVRATNGYVYPASHRAGPPNPQALPMGARLRLKPDRDLSSFRPEIQKIFRAMKKYGLIVADNGSDMYISGVYDPRWNNDILNPAFRSLTADDFEVVKLGYTATISAARYFSHVAVGGGFTNVFTITNTGGTTATGTLSLTDQGGKPFLVSLNGSPATSLAVSIDPGGTRIYTAAALSPSDPAKSGWAKLESAGGSLGGVGTFLFREGSVLKTIAGVLATQPTELATIPIDNDDTLQRFTGFAVANHGTGDINIKIVAVREDGTVADTLSPPELNPLGPQRQVARFLHEYRPTLSRFRGSMVLIGQGGNTFVVVALAQNEGKYTAIPAIPEKSSTINSPQRR